MKTVIIIPTYNEKENTELLIPMLEKEIKKISGSTKKTARGKI